MSCSAGVSPAFLRGVQMKKLPARRRRYLKPATCNHLNESRPSTKIVVKSQSWSPLVGVGAQLVKAGVSLLMSERPSSDFTAAMTDSVFAVGHFANSAHPLNLSVTSS